MPPPHRSHGGNVGSCPQGCGPALRPTRNREEPGSLIEWFIPVHAGNTAVGKPVASVSVSETRTRLLLNPQRHTCALYPITRSDHLNSPGCKRRLPIAAGQYATRVSTVEVTPDWRTPLSRLRATGICSSAALGPDQRSPTDEHPPITMRAWCGPETRRSGYFPQAP